MFNGESQSETLYGESQSETFYGESQSETFNGESQSVPNIQSYQGGIFVEFPTLSEVYFIFHISFCCEC